MKGHFIHAESSDPEFFFFFFFYNILAALALGVRVTFFLSSYFYWKDIYLHTQFLNKICMIWSLLNFGPKNAMAKLYMISSIPNYLSVLIGRQILRNLWGICKIAQLGSNTGLIPKVLCFFFSKIATIWGMCWNWEIEANLKIFYIFWP